MGENDPGSTHDSIKAANSFCSAFRSKGRAMKYYDFKCPKNGLMGKYITITSSQHPTHAAYDFFSAAEIELFGKILNLNQ